MSAAGDAAPAHRAYCLRRVNPFLGTVAVVASDGGRAFSVDGRNWQLQVAAHPPRGLWSGGGEDAAMRWFRFGEWSAAAGMTRVPLNPILDIDRMLAEAATLTAAIAAAADRLPFPLAPELELWLLDADAQPLALLATALDEAGRDQAATLDWSAGGRGGRPFRSPSLAARGIPERDAHGPARHARELEQVVRAAAGARRRARWFRRGDDGAGVGLAEPGDPAGDVGLGCAAFPLLGLRADWPEPGTSALFADYVDWLAPHLLTLPGLDDGLRARLEQAAAADALAVADRWRLYPRVLDAGLVTRARVEARLRRAAAPT